MSKEQQKTKSKDSSSNSKKSTPYRDTQASGSDNSIIQASLREDGTLDFAFELRKEFDLSEKLGKIGGYIFILGFFITIVTPIMYLNGIITSLSLVFAIMSAPFAIGGGLMTAANNFEYFPFSR